MKKPNRDEYKPLQLCQNENLGEWVFDHLPYELYSDDNERSNSFTIEEFELFLKNLFARVKQLLAKDPYPESERVTLIASKSGSLTLEVDFTYEETEADIDRRYEEDLKRYEAYRCRQIQQIERDIALRQMLLAELKG